MIWPFRRAERYVVTERDIELLKATSVAHLATMPGSDVVVGTLFTDPLAPPEDDPDDFYATTPEAAPERVTRGRYEPLDRAEVLRLRTSILSCLDPRAHGRLWMALERVSRWSELEPLLDRELPASAGAALMLTRSGPDAFAIVWTDGSGATRRIRLVRGESF